MSEDSHSVSTYPNEDQYGRWKRRADDRGMSMSEFVECMVEAGLKKFDATITRDESIHELRAHRNDLKTELQAARDRIERLEDELYHSEREAIREFVAENPGAEYEEIVQHIIDTAPARIVDRLDTLEGETLRVEDGEYYLADNANGGD